MGGLWAAYYGWRAIPAGPKQAEWQEWHRRFGRFARIGGLALMLVAFVQALPKFL